MKDELFEAVIHVAGWNYPSLTDSGRHWLNGALKELRAVNATPDEVLLRGRRYWAKYKTRPTPTALCKHWSALGDPTTIVFTPQDCTHLYQEGAEEDHRGQYCVRCKTWIPNVTQLRLIEGGDTA